MAEQTAMQQAVGRALTQALGAVERQLGEVKSSLGEVRAALDSGGDTAELLARVLPPLVQLQANGAGLAASIEAVLRSAGLSVQWAAAPMVVAAPVAAPAYAPPAARPAAVEEAAPAAVEEPAPVEAPPAPAAPAFDLDSLPDELKQLHKKAQRFARVTVQEFVMYKKDDVEKGRENKDLYARFKDEIDKSKELYDKRFGKIAEHNIDYFYDELVRVLAANDASALGDYPFPVPSRR
jgi:hypothetical protein